MMYFNKIRIAAIIATVFSLVLSYNLFFNREIVDTMPGFLFIILLFLITGLLTGFIIRKTY